MGPFPHNAPRSKITKDNPAGTDGFAFVEFMDPNPDHLRSVFTNMGYEKTAVHKTKAIELWQQGDITYVLNSEPDGFAARFGAVHGPCAPSMGWRVVDAQRAFAHAVAQGAEPYIAADRSFNLPAIKGIGGSLLYFVTFDGENDPLAKEFDRLRPDMPQGVGFHYLDHLTHNVFKGNMDRWSQFYADLFSFREIGFFKIDGKFTGLISRALTSPCGRIRIPINEDRGETGQIVDYLKRYNGEGIQHIAVGTNDIYGATDQIAANGVQFMPRPNKTYYDLSHARVTRHNEPLDRMRAHGILIDGEGVVNGGTTKILLQVFSRTMVGPIFFEFIQRKGDEGFGEGNFQALFESIERADVA